MTPPFGLMTPRELADKLAAGEAIFLLDVRRPEEHAFAALPGSVLIPLHQLAERLGEVTPPEGAAVVVYCHHGVRSQHGAYFLVQQGFANVHSLQGGIDAWSQGVDAGVPRY
jgi:rhodanese-related sulfurtransferase